MERRRRFLWILPVLLIAAAAGIGLARPKWVYEQHMVIEDDGMRQIDQKWFGGIPYSKVESIPELRVRPFLKAELAKVLHHPAGVDPEPVEAYRQIAPVESYFVRLKVKGDLTKIAKEYASQLSGGHLSLWTKRSPGELTGKLADGRMMQIILWDPVSLGRPPASKEGEFAFSWSKH